MMMAQESRAELRAHAMRGTCPHLQRPEIEPELSESEDDDIAGERMEIHDDDVDEAELNCELWCAAKQGYVDAVSVSVYACMFMYVCMHPYMHADL